LSSTDQGAAVVQLFSGTDEVDATSQHRVAGQVLRGWNQHATRATVAPRPERRDA